MLEFIRDNQALTNELTRFAFEYKSAIGDELLYENNHFKLQIKSVSWGHVITFGLGRVDRRPESCEEEYYPLDDLFINDGIGAVSVEDEKTGNLIPTNIQVQDFTRKLSRYRSDTFTNESGAFNILIEAYIKRLEKKSLEEDVLDLDLLFGLENKESDDVEKLEWHKRFLSK